MSVPSFERINLIYGANGAGKTSLASALDNLRNPEHGCTNVSICMSNSDKTNERLSDCKYVDEFERVFIFSENYVARNHNFNGEVEVEAVLTLGEHTIEEERQIAELKSLIDANQKELDKATRSKDYLQRTLNDKYKEISRNVVTVLSRAAGKYKSTSSYHMGIVRDSFAGSCSDWVLLSAKDMDSAFATVNSDERSLLEDSSYSFSYRAELVEEVASVLARSPVTVVLDTLTEYKDASNWVEEGYHLHQGLNKCIFCGGDLGEDRKKQIERHFSDEVRATQREVDVLIDEIKEVLTSLQGLLGDGGIVGSLFKDLQEDFNKAHTTAKKQVGELSSWLKELLNLLEEKRANLLESIEHKITDPPIVDVADIKKILMDHNDRVRHHETLRQEQAKKVELHILRKAEPEVTKLKSNLKERTKKKTETEESLQEHKGKLALLEKSKADPIPSATVITRELARILGRDEFSFELLSDKKHYRVTRYGKPARDLSTGERTAITLIHFLEKVKKSLPKSKKAIVVIDDPVSSLDSNVAMGISTYIWSETVAKNHIEQVFLLTHNFDLFRQWDIQIDGLPKERGPANNKGYPSNCYELTALHQNIGDTPTRVPKLIDWPQTKDIRLKVRSTYHHAFLVAVRAYQNLSADQSMEKKLDAMLLYPNMLRRILETFLAFKLPALSGDFTGSMREAVKILEYNKYEGEGDALRLQLTRFTHANSHADSPETDVTLNPDEICAVIKSVFTFMHAIDAKHFEGLCKVMSVEPSELL
jgi:wobble nucleotide-excising tRNase